MRMETVQPDITEDGDRTVFKHKAFGQIAANRVSGQQVLYGSDFAHNGYINITICASELHRNLAHDWHFGRNELITVSVSEAQWATFVSSMNMGSGVPCTINHVAGERMPYLPLPDKPEQFKTEADADVKDAIEQLKVALQELTDMGIPKAKANRIKARLDKAIQQLSQNRPFVAESFARYVEKTVEKAKVEIHGYMNGMLQRAGIKALGGEKPPLEIEDKT